MEPLESLEENSFCKLLYHRNTRENITDFLSWSYTFVTDGCGLNSVKLGKVFVFIYSPCFIKSDVGLCIFCVVKQITSKENKRLQSVVCISIIRAK